MSDKKSCPDKSIAAGAALVRVRHAAKSEDDAAKVKVNRNDKAAMASCFAEARAAVEAASDDLEANHGMAVHERGPVLDALYDAEDHWNHGRHDRAYVKILVAHNRASAVMDKGGMASPTNQQIAGQIGLLNRR